MRCLLDENLPHKLRRGLFGLHERGCKDAKAGLRQQRIEGAESSHIA
jgi:hypothetical protein